MTLVVQTKAGTNPETDHAIQQIISSYGLIRQETSLSFGAETFTYYSLDGQHADSIVSELMQLPAVAAAYVKPEGTPPM